MKLKPIYFVILLFLFSLGFRLYFSLNSEYFYGADSYFHIRIIDNFIENDNVMTYDGLGFSGKNFNYPQLFHFLTSLFLFIPYYLKIIPALMISSLILIIYFLTRELTKNEIAAIFSSFLAAFLPTEIKLTLNQINPYHLILPLIFLMFYCFLKIDNKKFFYLFLALAFLMPLIHPISLLFAFGLIFYMLLLNIDELSVDRKKKELIIFTFFLISFVNIIIYRKAFLFHGFNFPFKSFIIESNTAFLANFNIFTSIFYLSMLVFILGILGLFFGYFREKNDFVIMLSGFIVATLITAFMKLIDINILLLLLSLIFAVLSSLSIKRFFDYLRITKISSLGNYFILLFVVLTLLLSFYPSFVIAKSFSIDDKALSDLAWLRDNSDKNSVILAGIDDGYYVTGLAKRKNVLDHNILLAPDYEQRVKDVEVIYVTWSEAVAFDLIKKYNINYIYFSDKTKDKYAIRRILYIKDERCFEKERETIYKVVC